MTRWLLIACVVLAPVSAHGQRVLKVGDMVQTAGVPTGVVPAEVLDRLSRAGILTEKHMTMPVYHEERIYREYDIESHNMTLDAARAGDKAGVEDLVLAGRAAVVPHGTKVVVLRRTRGNPSHMLIPTKPAGTCEVRVTEGPSKGKIVELPVRCLRPLEESESP